jgi:hypothetical protein
MTATMPMSEAGLSVAGATSRTGVGSSIRYYATHLKIFKITQITQK